MTLAEWANLLLEVLRTVCSWPVATLIILIIFRIQIVELVREGGKRLKNVKIAGAEFDFETTDSFLGTTNVSAVSTGFGGDSQEYSSRRYGFRISSPCGDDWLQIQNPRDIAQFAGLVPKGSEILFVVIFTRMPQGRLKPNVNVWMEPVGDVTMDAYMAKSIRDILAMRGNTDPNTQMTMDSRIESFKVDQSTGGAFFSYVLSATHAQTGQVQRQLHVARIMLSKGLAFVATATVLEEDNGGDIQSNLGAILNSFVVDDATMGHACKVCDECPRLKARPIAVA